MSNLRTLLILLAALLLTGCLEGGIGGTGTGGANAGSSGDPNDPGADDNDATASLQGTGFATKGPFLQGATVTQTKMGAASGSTTQTEGALGSYTLGLELSTAYTLEARGRYFSESSGVDTEGEVALKSVLSTDGSGLNVNVATHLIHRRVMTLIDSGIAAPQAISIAESELLLALRDVVPPPANPVQFSKLVVLNGFQHSDNNEGNAWLLALSAVIEREAIRMSSDSGEPVDVEVGVLCDLLASGFETDGTLEAALVQRLRDARSMLNPDQMHRHLFEFARGHLLERYDSAIIASIDTLQSQTDDGEPMYHCEVYGDEVLCADTQMFPGGSRHQVMSQLGMMGGTTQETFSLEAYVANMNRFIDSDNDGIVNMDDDDDDNDGVVDSEDETPYGS